jgi:hypothetical protein
LDPKYRKKVRFDTSSLLNTGQQVGGAIGLAALGTIVWGNVAASARTQLAHARPRRPRPGTWFRRRASPGRIPVPILHSALASGISHGFTVAAAIMLAAVLIKAS